MATRSMRWLRRGMSRTRLILRLRLLHRNPRSFLEPGSKGPGQGLGCTGLSPTCIRLAWSAGPGFRRPRESQLAAGRGRRGDIELDRLERLRKEPMTLVPVACREPHLPPLLAGVHHPHLVRGGRVEALDVAVAVADTGRSKEISPKYIGGCNSARFSFWDLFFAVISTLPLLIMNRRLAISP